jgi:hypothetical protein
VPRLCVVYPDICLTTEEKARKNLSQGREKPQSDSESFTSSRLAVCRHYTNISHLLHLINAGVGKRNIQEDTYRFTMLSAHIYCRLSTNEYLVFNFLPV